MIAKTQSAAAPSLLTSRWTRPLALLAVAGLGVGAASLAVAPARALSALLAGAMLALAASLGGLAWLALFQVSNAGFFVVFKRVLEALAAALPMGAVMLLALLPGAPILYGWAHAAAATDPIVQNRHGFQTLTAFSLRMGLFLVLWLGFSYALRRESRAQDLDGDVSHTRRAVAISAVFLLLGGYSISLASVDWLMSADPHWASTIYGFYSIGGVLLTGALATLITVLALRRAGRLPELNESHLHDLGKLLFAFCTFWAYLWFSQFLLIWYANLPEETAWILTRTRNGWAPWFYGNVLINWALPFVLLLPRGAKRDPAYLARVAALVLVGRFVDLWLQVAPANQPHAPALPWIEAAVFVGTVSLFALVVARALGKEPLIARHDPYLEEALHHRT